MFDIYNKVIVSSFKDILSYILYRVRDTYVIEKGLSFTKPSFALQVTFASIALGYFFNIVAGFFRFDFIMIILNRLCLINITGNFSPALNILFHFSFF